MNPLNPAADLALIERERHRLAAEIARPRRDRHGSPAPGRLWERLSQLFHRDA